MEALMDQSVVPAAQYLRMSTEHQEYSLTSQTDAISRYAQEHGFVIVKTYADAARSGLRLRNRSALKQLLADVVRGDTDFRVILVYDVSRWGRFQDADESAHYEYLCKSSGVPVHYCAEIFANDTSMPSVIMKVLKRTMAGEYSRELSVKVRAGQERLATLGYKLGGMPVYGLRRLLLDTQGKPKQLLSAGQRKSLTTERVILVPGPANEVAVVRRIFREFAEEHRSMHSIASRLNDDEIAYVTDGRWSLSAVRRTLKQPQYTGTLVWGRTSGFLGAPVRSVPHDRWVTHSNAFEPIVHPELFRQAQKRFEALTHNLSDDELLRRLRKILNARGILTSRIIDKSRVCPAITTYRRRFGSLLNAYARLGYSKAAVSGMASRRQHLLFIRRTLIDSILAEFPDQIDLVPQSRKWRAVLRQRETGLLIAVVTARCYLQRNVRFWLVFKPSSEGNQVIVLARMDDRNSSVSGLTVQPMPEFRGESLRLREHCAWLREGVPIQKISDLLQAIARLHATPS